MIRTPENTPSITTSQSIRSLPAHMSSRAYPQPVEPRTAEGATMTTSDPFEGTIGRTFRDSEPWWPPLRTAPQDRPNVVIILFDDLGFSHLNCYGSTIETPNINRLAANGLRFSNFHVTRAVLADTSLAVDRPQPSHGRDALDRQLQPRLPEHARRDQQERRHDGGDAARRELRHVRGRQVAPQSLRRVLRRRALHRLAAAARV